MATTSNQSEIVQNIIHTTNMPEFSINENWNLWHERLELHFVEIGCTTDNGKISTLLKHIGSEAYGILHSICSPDLPSSKSYRDLCDILSQHFTPPVIVFRERKNFYSAKKTDDETVAAWFARVKKLSLNCKFGTSLDRIVLDKFIVELPSKIFEKLCEETERLSTADAFRKALIMESKCIAQSNTNNEVSFVRPRGSNYNNTKKQTSAKGSNNNNNGQKKKPCSHCGWKNHASSSCKYRNSICHTCKKEGHLANICNQSKKKDKDVQSSCSYITTKDDNYINDFFFSICSIDGEGGLDSSIFSIGNQSMQPYELRVEVNGNYLSAICDTGAPCSLMSVENFEKNFDQHLLQRCSTPFTGYGGDLLDIVGEFMATVKFRGQVNKCRFLVTNTTRPTLLGRDFLRGFGFELIQSDN